MHEHRAKSGKLIYYATRHELETLPGYRGNDRKGRARCPVHQGENPTALSIDWATGWASCWSCGDAWSIRIGDSPEHSPPRSTAGRPAPRPSARATPTDRNLDTVRATLAKAIETAAGNLPGSPGETYLAGRGIPLDVAQTLRLGWASAGALAGRVVFPLRDPDGIATSATGRAVSDHTQPKYKALKSGDGYVKTLFNGGAITQAKQSGHPVVVVEGPLDAAACVAAGLPLTVALCGKSYQHPEHFAGLATVILALDADDAGQEGRRRLWLDLIARGIDVLVLPASALDGAKDLGEYWERHRAIPDQIAARAMGPHICSTLAEPQHGIGTEPGESVGATLPSLEELKRQAAEATRHLKMVPDDLPDDLRADAESLAVELAGDHGALGEFWVDLRQNGHTLATEDRVAAHYAMTLALARWPSRPQP